MYYYYLMKLGVDYKITQSNILEINNILSIKYNHIYNDSYIL